MLPPLSRPLPSLIAHMDLKGVQLLPPYVLEALESLRSLGYQALLVEYEDVFPFRSANFSEHPEEIWSREFLEVFLTKSEQLGIEIIPLQQCLSHLEYAFRSEDHRQFCIPYGAPSGLDIGRSEAREWMKGHLREVLEAHPNSRYIHIGMDEARSLVIHATKEGKEPLPLLLDYLDELCSLCEEYGKTPLIWGDMLEEHLASDVVERLRSLKDRVVIVSWDYMSKGEPQTLVRFSGMRCSRRWMEEPWNAPCDAPVIQNGVLWFEDWPDGLQALVSRYRTSPWEIESFFQAAVWRDLGFTVLGAAGGAITFDRSLLPHYHQRYQNIVAWKAFTEKEALGGVIVTHWARSNSNSTPNLLPDVVWPVLAQAGAGIDRFFQGVSADRLEQLFDGIGRCREGWQIEDRLLAEMDELTPEIRTHREAWETIRLMLELQRVMRELEALEELGRCYGGIGRLPAVTWEQHKDGLRSWKGRLLELESRTRKHLTARYAGAALEEWFIKVFYAPTERIAQLQRVIKDGILLYERKRQPAKAHQAERDPEELTDKKKILVD